MTVFRGIATYIRNYFQPKWKDAAQTDALEPVQFAEIRRLPAPTVVVVRL